MVLGLLRKNDHHSSHQKVLQEDFGKAGVHVCNMDDELYFRAMENLDGGEQKQYRYCKQDEIFLETVCTALVHTRQKGLHIILKGTCFVCKIVYMTGL